MKVFLRILVVTLTVASIFQVFAKSSEPSSYPMAKEGGDGPVSEHEPGI